MYSKKADKYVLFYNHTSIVGGAEISLLEMLKEVKNRKVILACPEGELRDRAEKYHIPVLTAPSLDVGFKIHPYNFLAFLISLIKLIRWFFKLSVPLNTVYVNSIRGALGCLVYTLVKRVNLIVHIRDVIPSQSLKRIVRFLLLRFSAKIVFNSEFSLEKFTDTFSCKKCEVLYSPVGYKFYRDIDASIAKQELNLEKRYPIISVVGQITPWKRQDFAIEVLEILTFHYPRSLLLVVGDIRFSGKLRRYDNLRYFTYLKHLIEKKGLSRNVFFTGFKENVEVVLAASEVLFLPSIGEPFGRVVGEAMAMGIPVLVCSEGGMGRIVKERKLGYTFEPRDSPEKVAQIITAIIENRTESRERAIRGLLFAFENLPPFVIAEKLESILHDAG